MWTLLGVSLRDFGLGGFVRGLVSTEEHFDIYLLI